VQVGRHGVHKIMITLTREEAQKLLDGFERVGWARTEHADILRARLEIEQIVDQHWEDLLMFAEAIEAKLKEKNS
jgi:hypothetical protein